MGCVCAAALAIGIQVSFSAHAYGVCFKLNGKTVSRQKTIKDMLGRHALQMDDDTLTLLRDFSVPSAWVSEAQARLALAEGDHFAAAQHFVEADLLPEAHELVVWDLAPEVVLSQDMDTLDALLEPFIGRELACHFSEGGRLFQVYASAMRLQEDLQAGRSETIAALREELPRVLVALPTFLVKRGDSRRPLVREAAVSQMLASCTKIWGLLDSTGVSANL